MPRSSRDRSAVLAVAAIAAAVAVTAATIAHCLQAAATDSTATIAEAKPVVRDRAGYHLVIEEYPGGSTWRQYDDGRVEYIIEGGN